MMFSTTDRWGRRIELTRECWRQHVLLRHGELIDHVDSIQSTIERPDFVQYDARFSNRESFYALGIVKEFEAYYLKVSVEFSSEQFDSQIAGTVITAYISRNVKPGEELKWRRRA